MYFLRTFVFTLPSFLRAKFEGLGFAYAHDAQTTPAQTCRLFLLIASILIFRKITLKLLKCCLCAHIKLDEENSRGKEMYLVGLKQPNDNQTIFYSYHHVLHTLRFGSENLDNKEMNDNATVIML